MNAVNAENTPLKGFEKFYFLKLHLMVKLEIEVWDGLLKFDLRLR